jgi:hypothetical protein
MWGQKENLSLQNYVKASTVATITLNSLIFKQLTEINPQQTTCL